MIAENVKHYLGLIEGGNPFGEKITLVAATKTRTPKEINEAIAAGISDIGENKVQEFKDKYDLIDGANRHFIGHLQTNKVKYLIGKTYLYHSVDRDELAEEIAKRSERAEIISDILLQVNIGNEESKGGYPLEAAFPAYLKLKNRAGLRILGFMAMLPAVGTEEELRALCGKMRALYERAKTDDGNIRHLSMGMSGDWRLCVECGANMIRLGSALFGERVYS